MSPFAEAAHEILARLDAGEDPETWQTARGSARRLEGVAAGRSGAGAADRSASGGPDQAPVTTTTAARARQQAVDDQLVARQAIQGLVGLAEPGRERVYDGPVDPDSLLAYFGHTSFRPGQREAVAGRAQRPRHARDHADRRRQVAGVQPARASRRIA